MPAFVFPIVPEDHVVLHFENSTTKKSMAPALQLQNLGQGTDDRSSDSECQLLDVCQRYPPLDFEVRGKEPKRSSKFCFKTSSNIHPQVPGLPVKAWMFIQKSGEREKSHGKKTGHLPLRGGC